MCAFALGYLLFGRSLCRKLGRYGHIKPDEYGWVAMDNGFFSHIHTDITADRHPFDEELAFSSQAVTNTIFAWKYHLSYDKGLRMIRMMRLRSIIDSINMSTTFICSQIKWFFFSDFYRRHHYCFK
ncbi:uncharacterized protein BYT42DRAFT_490817 [Radiomyces spectabilis]|uniref:uncharacterized protein n=1 Tax=Radiomyces spectabilis TaxID=64574 RepID=UPI002220E7EB|nr:uncharacterized protein BYT42DRAFT_490817 [Radiomyces spectabilis]KAI8391347.1 hypothetical protein BYT42DRAFT_490817 [Radiomyces spectabilis]